MGIDVAHDDGVKRNWFHDLMGKLSMSLKQDALATLLQGNDAQCFTEAQYVEAYVARQTMNTRANGAHADLIRKVLNPACVRRHLLSLNLREVKPGVWAPKPLTEDEP